MMRKVYGRRTNSAGTARRPEPDPAFDAELLEFIGAVMSKGEARIARLSFGEHDIEFDLVVCKVTCYTQIEWIDVDGKRRLIDADHGERSAKHGALIRLLGRRATRIRLVPEGLQVDIEAGGTLHCSRLEGGVSFEIGTARFGPALY